MIKQEILNELNNVFYKEAKELILNNYECKCNSCTHQGFYAGSKCEVCGTISNEVNNNLSLLNDLIIRYEEVYKRLNIKEIKENDFMNLIASLDSHLPFVSAFLARHNYSEKYNSTKADIIGKIEKIGSNISEEELHIIENESYKDKSDIDTTMAFYYACHKSLKKEPNIEYPAFVKLFEKYVEGYNPDNIRRDMPVKCAINKALEENIFNKHIIKIDNSLLKDFYNGDNWKALEEAYRRLVYVDQYYVRKYDPLAIKGIKDVILCNLIPNYYEENYDNLYFVVEAKYLSFWRIITTLDDNIKIGFNAKDRREHVSVLREYQKRFKDNKRIVNENKYNIDKVFNKIVFDMPDVLNSYPPLNYLYKLEDNHVLPKTMEELQQDREELNNRVMLDEMLRKRINALYNIYLSSHITYEPYVPDHFRKL